MRRFSRLIETQKTKAAAALAFGCLLAIVSAGGVFGAFSATVSSTGNQFTTASDLTPPTIARAALQKSYGGVDSFTGCGLGGCSVLSSRQFYVFAQVTDGGSPPSGIASVNTTIGGANSPLTSSGGPWTVGGQSYNYRTAFITRTPVQLPAGAGTFSISATDNGGRSSNSGGHNFQTDTTRPVPSSVTVANGGTAARPDSGDTVTYAFDSAIDPSSVLGNWTVSGPPITYLNSWDGSSTNVTAIFDGPSQYGGAPTDPVLLRIERSANAGGPQVNLGQVRLTTNEWGLQCRAQFNGTLQMLASNQQARLTLGSLTSGVIQVPAPPVPTEEDC